MKTITLLNEQATLQFAAQLASHCSSPLVIYLQGQLGAGKTCFMRGFLQALGHNGAVKSPTYTLVETYHLPNFVVHHFDLYRLSAAEELEYIGIEEYFHEDSVCCIEWPEKGLQYLPAADLICQLQIVGDSRQLSFQSASAKGVKVLQNIS